MSATPHPKVPWRDLTRTVLIPNLLHGTGQGAAVPVLPLAAMSLSGSPATAAVVTAMLTVGQLVLTIPAGGVVSRFGERRSMLVSTVISGVGGLLACFTSSLTGLVAGALLMGGGSAVFSMARHTWVTMAVPPQVRGRSLASLAGSTRLGLLAGPFLAAAVLHLTRDVWAGFLIVSVVCVLLAGLLMVTRFPENGRGANSEEPARHAVGITWHRRDVLLTLGLSLSVITTMRNTKRILIPLVGAAVGLDEVTVALVVGGSYALDFSLFYLGGAVADRWGRLAVALPALVGFGLSHVALALATSLPAGRWWYLSGVLVMALANGISGGVVPTVGSDLADPRSPAPFLASWRLTTELLPTAAPLGIAVLAGALSLGAACAAIALLAGAGAVLLPGQFRRHLPSAYRPMNHRSHLNP